MPESDSISLREFFEKMMQQQEEHMELRFSSLDKALMLSRDEMNRSLESLNELRQQVVSDRGAFIISDIYNSHQKDLAVWRDGINRKLTILETRSITWTAAVGVFFVILTLVMRWFGK